MEDYAIQYTKKQYVRLIILLSILTSLTVTLAFNMVSYGLPAQGITQTTTTPTPIITSISPASVPLGSPDTTITINSSTSSYFSQGSVAWVGLGPSVSSFRLPLATTYVSSNQLKALMPASSLVSDGTTTGKLNITVSDSTGTNVSNAMLFTVTNVVAASNIIICSCKCKRNNQNLCTTPYGLIGGCLNENYITNPFLRGNTCDDINGYKWWGWERRNIFPSSCTLAECETL